MKVIKRTVMIRIHLTSIQNIRQYRLNQIIIVVSEIVAALHRVVNIKSLQDDEVQAAVVTVVVIHVIQIDHESIRDENDHHLMMIVQADQAKEATNVINIHEKKATPEVIAIKEVGIE